MGRWRIELDTDTAALELLLAQMAQEYRRKFRLGFPTEGDSLEPFVPSGSIVVAVPEFDSARANST